MLFESTGLTAVATREARYVHRERSVCSPQRPLFVCVELLDLRLYWGVRFVRLELPHIRQELLHCCRRCVFTTKHEPQASSAGKARRLALCTSTGSLSCPDSQENAERC